MFDDASRFFERRFVAVVFASALYGTLGCRSERYDYFLSIAMNHLKSVATTDQLVLGYVVYRLKRVLEKKRGVCVLFAFSEHHYVLWCCEYVCPSVVD